jgi:hypothetical protein
MRHPFIVVIHFLLLFLHINILENSYIDTLKKVIDMFPKTAFDFTFLIDETKDWIRIEHDEEEAEKYRAVLAYLKNVQRSI